MKCARSNNPGASFLNESQEFINLLEFFFRGLLCTKVSVLSEFWFYSIFWRKKNNWNILWENHSFSIVGSLGWFLLKVKSSLIHRNFFQGCCAQKYVVYTSFWFYFIFFLQFIFWELFTRKSPIFYCHYFWKSLDSLLLHHWQLKLEKKSPLAS